MLTLPLETLSGKIVVKCPTSIHNLSTEVYQRIIKEWKYDGTLESLAKLFAIMTGQPIATYLDAKNEYLDMHLIELTRFVFYMEIDLHELKHLPYFKYNNKIITLPKELERLTLVQGLNIKQAVMSNDPREYTAFAMAVYLQPLIDEQPFNIDRVKELEKEFKTWPISRTYPIGFFYSSQRKPCGYVQRLFSPLTRRIMLELNNVKRLVNKPKLTY